MVRLRLSWLSALLLGLLVSNASAQTQTELNESSCQEFKKADAELNDTYGKIRAAYKEDAEFLGKLQTAQKAWLAFRDAELDAVYPAADKETQYGSVYPMCRCQALASLTTQRVEQLKQWLTGVEEGDVCAGSVRPKEE
jgi:uncharacterized protein YecT (DUF1311 family)